MVKADNGAPGAYRVGRELGTRALRSFAAIREPNELVVVQRFVAGNDPKLRRSDGVITLGVDAMNQLLRDAESLARNWHPNIARVKHVDGDAMKLTIATDLVDGMTLGDLFAARAAPLLPYPVIVRVLVDVLAGLNALHALRDGTRAAGTIHGAVCPANVVVGRDGVARIVSCLRPRPVRVDEGAEALAYAAPEALDEGGTKDGRSDVYAVGVILWQALMGMMPYEASDPAQLLARQRSEEVVTPPVDAGSTFAGLGEVAIRAMAFEPSLRYRTTAEMATALRKLAGAEIASGAVVAARVAELGGDRIRARRAELDPKTVPLKRRAPDSSAHRIAAAAPVAAPIEESTPAVAMDAEPEVDVAPITARGEARVAAPERETAPPPLREDAPVRAVAPPLPAAALRGPEPLASVIVAPTSSAPVLAAAPVAPGASVVLTPTAVFPPGVTSMSLSASEAPPPRRRRSRAAAILFLGAALVILLVAGVRTLVGNEQQRTLGTVAAAPTAPGVNATGTAAPASHDVTVAPTATASADPSGDVATTVSDRAASATNTPAPKAAPANTPPAGYVEPRPAAKKKTYDPLGI